MAGRAVFFDRVETLIAAMMQDAGVRLPRSRRYGLARKSAEEGAEIPANVLESLRK